MGLSSDPDAKARELANLSKGRAPTHGMQSTVLHAEAEAWALKRRPWPPASRRVELWCDEHEIIDKR